eukprot:c9592_g1_i1.p1 GENE.c9592_g1_i1~~c9592_g1_i1.p1  ORF type:complete len:278 (+),score=68.91 c9592_g1_i1:378-1211(+)
MVYLVAVLNCAVWFTYAYITPDRFQLMVTNLIGLIIESVYILLYLWYSKGEKRRYLLKQLAIFGSVFVCIILVAEFGAPHFKPLQKQNPEASLRSIFLGLACVVINAMLYAAPLSILRLVISSKSSHYLSISIAFGTLWCSGTWFAYALCVSDINIVIPNGLGVGLGVIQIVFWFVYRPKTATATATVTTSKAALVSPSSTSQFAESGVDAKILKAYSEENNNSSNNGSMPVVISVPMLEQPTPESLNTNSNTNNGNDSPAAVAIELSLRGPASIPV